MGEGQAALRALFSDEDVFPEDPDLPAFGVLYVVHGWVGPQGPGVALRLAVCTSIEPDAASVAVRLREQGRYVRAALRGFDDKHRDLTVVPELYYTDEDDIYAFTAWLPYAAIPESLSRDLALEVQLLEDDDPIEEGLWRFTLPGRAERLVEGPLGAVVLAAVAVGGAAVDLEPVGDLFRLDVVGERVAAHIAATAAPGDLMDIADRLRRAIAPEAYPRIVDLLTTLVVDERSARLVEQIEELLGRAPGRKMADPALVVHYRTLGLSPSADWDAVRASYRRLARAHHPDRAADPAVATEKMKQVNAAYAALAEVLRRTG